MPPTAAPPPTTERSDPAALGGAKSGTQLPGSFFPNAVFRLLSSLWASYRLSLHVPRRECARSATAPLNPAPASLGRVVVSLVNFLMPL